MCPNSKTKELQLHHWTYKFKGHPDPVVELGTVITVCRRCHAQHHGKAANDAQYELFDEFFNDLKSIDPE